VVSQCFVGRHAGLKQWKSRGLCPSTRQYSRPGSRLEVRSDSRLQSSGIESFGLSGMCRASREGLGRDLDKQHFPAHHRLAKMSRGMVGVAQLVRAPDCGSGCRGFESPLPPFFSNAGLVSFRRYCPK
jgi:hypothetical protein